LNLSYLTLGALHVPVFGLFAAIGLMAAMLLSQRTSRMVGLPPDRIWNAGLLAILAAFIVSRLLLVAEQPRAFLTAPLTILALPSLTYTGVWITCLLMFLYLRLRRLPVLTVLDAAAPCAAVVWLALALGHFAEGTAAGIPTHLPWGITIPGDTMLGRVHPTQLYTAMAALALLAASPWLLARRKHAGDTAAFALLFGGLADFLIGMLRQPWETYGTSWLDPAQAAALLLVLGGGILLATPRPLVVSQIEPTPAT